MIITPRIKNKYRGYPYMVIKHELDEGRTGMWFYCAYVRLPKKHPYYELTKITNIVDFQKIMDDINKVSPVPMPQTNLEPMTIHDGHNMMNVECNGGLTFSEYFEKAQKPFSRGAWIGWDYGHAWNNIHDQKFLQTMSQETQDFLNPDEPEDNPDVSLKDVEKECFDVINQLITIEVLNKINTNGTQKHLL